MTWWRRLWRRRQMEELLEKELRFHLEEHAAELVTQGVCSAEARRQARLALGGPEQVKERCRDARSTRWLEDLWCDFAYALRTLRQRPGFAMVAIATLGLGIGASTVMFTVINGVLLKPLPYPEPDRLVAVHGHSEGWNTAVYGQQNLTYPDFVDCQRESGTLALAGFVFNGGTASEPGEPEYVDRREISANLFSTLGVSMQSGRAFLAEEDHPGTPVIILSYSFWQRHFAGSAAAIGKSLVVDGQRYTVVGVTPAGFRLAGEEPDVFTPLGQDTAGYLQKRVIHPVNVVARLHPDTTLAQARTELALIGGRLAGQYPDTNAGRSFLLQPLRPDVADVGSTLWLLLGAVGLVLLIACANVASLLLARAVSREKELAMRVALGASRGRLARQCLTESAVLGLAGGLLGVLLANAGIGPFVAMWPGSMPRAEEVHVDWRVLLFALGVSLVSGVLFGLAPALRAPTRDLEQILRVGARSIAGSSRRLHRSFVICEISLAVVLLVAAGMLGRTLLYLVSLQPGVDTQNVLVTRMALSPGTLGNPATIRVAWDDVLMRAHRVPGVQSIAIVDTVPMREGNNQLGYWPTADVPPENKMPFALATCVSPDYLKVMGMSLKAGRFFDEHDGMGSDPVIVIDEVLAEHAFGKENPVGKRLWIPEMGPSSYQIAGVVGHVRHWGLAGDDQAQVRAQFYYPFAQLSDRLLRRWSELMSIAVRTGIEPLSVVEPLRVELRGATGDQVLYEVHTMEQLTKGTLARQRFLLLLFGIFASLAMLLACIGIYGVLAYLTDQRLPEMGVRMALGASAGDLIWLVLRQSLGMIFIGVAVGIGGALAAGRLLLRLVEGMQPAEPLTFGVVIPALVAAALFASFLPARRAGGVDPVSVLRQE
jgi:predicted permease